MAFFKVTISNLDYLKKYQGYLEKVKSMKSDSSFCEYLSAKCLEIVNQTASERLMLVDTTNDDQKADYLRNNKIKDISNKGFIIYNDLCVESSDYTFSIALAFEYGTGIVGRDHPKKDAWAYYMNENTVFVDDKQVEGWWISKEKAGNSATFGESLSGKAVVTRGYEGMEIYRFSVEKIKELLPQWIKSYLEGTEV